MQIFIGDIYVINLNLLTIHRALKLARFLHDIKVKRKGGINVKGKVTGFIHSGITVKDLEISLDFYVNKLGLELISRQISSNEYISDIVELVNLQEVKIAFIRIPGGNEIELLEYVGMERYPGNVRPCDYGSGHICLKVEGIEEMYEYLKLSGVRFRSKKIVEITLGANKGSKAIYMYDPDGYIIELMEKSTN